MPKKKAKNIEWKTPRKIFLVFLFLILVLFGRYCYLALSPTINGRNMKVFAESRNTVSKVLTAKRGTIYDATGNILAQNVTSYTLIAYLDSSSKNEASRLSKLCHMIFSISHITSENLLAISSLVKLARGADVFISFL